MKSFKMIICLCCFSTLTAQKASIEFELNGRPSYKELVDSLKTSKNPFSRFIGEWTLKEDIWIQNWGNQTDTIKIPNHHTISSQLNTENTLLSIIDGPEPNGHIFWSYNPNTKEVSHLSSFGTIRAGVGQGNIDEKGDLTLKIKFEGEPKNTYRIYNYSWISEDSYHMRSVQYDQNDQATGLFYEGTFIKLKSGFNVDDERKISSNVLKMENSENQLIKDQSAVLAQFIRQENLDLVSEVFDDQSFILPEYHKTLGGLADISKYYEDFFHKTENISYSKKSFEIQPIDHLYLEIGTFEHQYKTPNESVFTYTGKYLTYWKLPENGTPKIVAHIWGASHYFEAENLEFVAVPTTDEKPLKPKTKWERNIEAARKYAYDAVLNGNAKKQSKSYAEDAIYMTYYDPPFIGKPKISEYFDSHYNPEVTRDSLATWAVKIIELGNYALKFGEYYVAWTYENKPNFIRGKGLSLYRRRDDGKIEIYRQMINHSMPPTPKVNDE